MTEAEWTDAPLVPAWISHFLRGERQTELELPEVKMYRVSAAERESFAELVDAYGVSIRMDEEGTLDAEIHDEDQYRRVAGEAWVDAHPGETEVELFRSEIGESLPLVIRLVRLGGKVLSMADQQICGPFGGFERRRLYETPEQAFDDPGEAFFDVSGPLVSVQSVFHSAEEVAARLHWLEHEDAHEFTINGERWRYDPGRRPRCERA